MPPPAAPVPRLGLFRLPARLFHPGDLPSAPSQKHAFATFVWLVSVHPVLQLPLPGPRQPPHRPDGRGQGAEGNPRLRSRSIRERWCYDNSVMGRFFSSLTHQWMTRQKFPDREAPVEACSSSSKRSMLLLVGIRRWQTSHLISLKPNTSRHLKCQPLTPPASERAGLSHHGTTDHSTKIARSGRRRRFGRLD